MGKPSTPWEGQRLAIPRNALGSMECTQIPYNAMHGFALYRTAVHQPQRATLHLAACRSTPLHFTSLISYPRHNTPLTLLHTIPPKSTAHYTTPLHATSCYSTPLFPILLHTNPTHPNLNPTTFAPLHFTSLSCEALSFMVTHHPVAGILGGWPTTATHRQPWLCMVGMWELRWMT